MYRVHRKGPGGPPGGATYPGGPHGLKWGREPAPGGLVRPPWASPAPRVGNPRGGGRPPLACGGIHPLPPLAAAPFGDLISQGLAPPRGPINSGGEGGQHRHSLGRLPPPLQHLSLSRRSSAKPCRRPATSTTTPSCCWISINLSFPLAGSRRRRRCCTVRVLNAEVPSVRHSVIGDLDHGEYDSVIHVHWNASARDLQGYVDALLSPRC